MPPFDELMLNTDEAAVIYKDGRFSRVLRGPGRFDVPRHIRFFWQRWNPTIEITRVNTGEQRREIGDIKVRTSDGKTVSITLILDHKITNPETYIARRIDLGERLTTDARLTLERFLGEYEESKILDITKREELENEFLGHFQKRTKDYGLSIQHVYLTTTTVDNGGGGNDGGDNNQRKIKFEGSITHE